MPAFERISSIVGTRISDCLIPISYVCEINLSSVFTAIESFVTAQSNTKIFIINQPSSYQFQFYGFRHPGELFSKLWFFLEVRS